MTWLSDSVYSIREAATENLKKLTQIFGEEWAKVNLIPKITAIQDNSNYLYRMTTLFAISALSEVMKPETIVEQLLGTVTKMQYDPVPNIRFNVAKTLHVIIPKVEAKAIELIKSCLLNLQDDDDPDVKFFATMALQHT
jgi:serine/threonine-protein phosphatase 2A regulatory subunit A